MLDKVGHTHLASTQRTVRCSVPPPSTFLHPSRSSPTLCALHGKPSSPHQLRASSSTSCLTALAREPEPAKMPGRPQGINHVPQLPEMVFRAKDASHPGVVNVPAHVQDIGPHPGSEARSESSLEDLSRLFCRSRNQIQPAHRLQRQFHDINVATACNARLIAISRSIWRTLAECLDAGDKQSFANLFLAYHDAADSISRLPNTEIPVDYVNLENFTGYDQSFLDMLPSQSQTAIKNLLFKVRYDGDFIASRLATLSRQEVSRLTPSHHTTKSTESVLSVSSGPTSRQSRQLAFEAVRDQRETLGSLDYSSHLQTLVYCVRGLSSSFPSEAAREMDVWSTVCAKLFTGQQAASKLIPSILDLFAQQNTWPGKQHLELWISETLQNGSLVTEPRDSFISRKEGPSESVQEAFFYETAVDSLLHLMGSGSPACVIPETVLNLCRATCAKLPNGSNQQRDFTYEVLNNWLFSLFIPAILTLPEAYGLMLKCHIESNVRKRVLREVAIRAQNTVYQVTQSPLWPNSTSASLRTTTAVYSILKSFRAPPIASLSKSARPSIEETWATVTSNDVKSLINTLFPERSYVGTTSPELRISSQSLSSSTFSALPISRVPLTEPSTGYNTPLASQRHGFLSSSLEFPNFESDDSPGPHWFANLSHAEEAQLRDAHSNLSDLVSTRTGILWAPLIISPGSNSFHTPRQSLKPMLHESSSTDRSDDKLRQILNVVQDLLLSDMRRSQSSGLSKSTHNYNLSRREQVIRALEGRLHDAEAECDFIAAHEWSRHLRTFRSAIDSGSTHLLSKTFALIEDQASTTLNHSKVLLQSFHKWYEAFSPYNRRLTDQMAENTYALGFLRDKVYFTTEISAPYQNLKSTVAVLRGMINSKSQTYKSTQRSMTRILASKTPGVGFRSNSKVQELESLSCSSSRGGPNKLNDTASHGLSQWLAENQIRNLCQGEERIHKLCQEIRKFEELAFSSIGALKMSVDVLYAREKRFIELENASYCREQASKEETQLRSPNPPLFGGTDSFRNFNFSSLRASSNESFTTGESSASIPYPLSNSSSREYVASMSSSFNNGVSRSWSPAMTEDRSPSVASGPPSMYQCTMPPTNNSPTNEPFAGIIQRLRRNLNSLALSDCNLNLFNKGSETDQIFWTGLGGDISERYMCRKYPEAREGIDAKQNGANQRQEFNFKAAFKSMLRSFSANPDPFKKLTILCDIEKLLQHYPRQERNPSELTESVQSCSKFRGSTTSVEGFRSLFIDSDLRPPTIFRDLQYIAGLIPSAQLDLMPEGQSFNNAVDALLSLKTELTENMVHTAYLIVKYHDEARTRNGSQRASMAQRERDAATTYNPNSGALPVTDVAQYSMRDAALLFATAAKEGHVVAQRELGYMYLCMSDLPGIVLAPLSCSDDVFSKARAWSEHHNDEQLRNPIHMCLAEFWLNKAAEGGDELSKRTLEEQLVDESNLANNESRF
ncbi:Hypothetical protein R9X50_00677300 [Acrodontium crateriforme]|uniref:Uncharacterized protein n=1 Tax=Acrodontium crateriforme TaxID=150365 RepID=A0AAQ3MA96_9PEZI|nr:Hypothetical protein R9X50_00677300 [Acrodontium crateriforme]